MKLWSARSQVRLPFRQAKLLTSKTKTNSRTRRFTCQVITRVFRVRSGGSLCWIFGGQRGTLSDFSLIISVFPCHLLWHQWPIFTTTHLQSVLLRLDTDSGP